MAFGELSPTRVAYAWRAGQRVMLLGLHRGKSTRVLGTIDSVTPQTVELTDDGGGRWRVPPLYRGLFPSDVPAPPPPDPVKLAKRAAARARLLPGTAKGKVRDLDLEQAAIIIEMFRSEFAPLPIRWAATDGREAARTIRLGYYDPVRKQITISRVFDDAGVPIEALRAVVYHEMLHHVLRPTAGVSGRREIHTRVFRARERLYPGFRTYEAWASGPLKDAMRASLARKRAAKAAPRPNPRRAPVARRRAAITILL